MQKKVFETEYAAKRFAEEVGGTIEAQTIPGYMWVETVWVVRWKGSDE